jgi:hypothetical protein
MTSLWHVTFSKEVTPKDFIRFYTELEALGCPVAMTQFGTLAQTPFVAIHVTDEKQYDLLVTMYQWEHVYNITMARDKTAAEKATAEASVLKGIDLDTPPPASAPAQPPREKADEAAPDADVVAPKADVVAEKVVDVAAKVVDVAALVGAPITTESSPGPSTPAKGTRTRGTRRQKTK